MKKFVTAINCMDGRVQEPVINYMKKKYNIDYIDMITEPGPDKILAEGENKFKIESIKERVDISVIKHGSKLIAMVSHDDCAGNPVDKETHITQTKESIKTISTWNHNVKIIGLWIDENWDVYELE
ncbi:MAG: hypothetical protein K8R58_02130 [Bacteroidales bacterium]|nr:hypothetical protein [Bacteroidales bacterium]